MSFLAVDLLDHKDLIDRTAIMLRDFLMREVFHDSKPSELAVEWGISKDFVNTLITAPKIPFGDVLGMAKRAGLDFGITLRDPGTGKEVSLFACNNLTGTDEGVSQETQEVITYGPVQLADRFLEGIRIVHEVDGFYKEREDEILCENCLDAEALPDSIICHSCQMAGVSSSPPEHIVLEEGSGDPLEVLAMMTNDEETHQYEKRLLITSGLMADED